MQKVTIHSPYINWGYTFTITLTDNYLFLCELFVGSNNFHFVNFNERNFGWLPSHKGSSEYYNKEFSNIDELTSEINSINFTYLLKWRNYINYKGSKPRIIKDVTDHERSLFNLLKEEETRKHNARLDFLSLSLFRLEDRE